MQVDTFSKSCLVPAATRRLYYELLNCLTWCSLERLTGARKALTQFNQQSKEEFVGVRQKLQQHTGLLGELKEDLLHVYNQIR